MSRQFEGKVALVTGGNSGIGKATAVAFAKEGAKVTIAARREALGRETAKEIRNVGGEAIFIKADMSEAADIQAMVNETVETFGRLDYAFNNAGRYGGRPLLDATEEEWDEFMNINLKGTWLCMKYEIPEMIKVGGGAIVNNSSVSGEGGWDGGSLYVASKHGINGLTKCAAIEFAKQGVRVNAVEPGIIETPAWGEISPERRIELNAMQPIPRMASADEVADPVIWLCSKQSSYVTGVTLLVDGGMCARP